MFVAVQHTISDPTKFWEIAKDETSALPEGLKLHSVYPSPDGATCNCLWEASSVSSLQDWMDEKLGSQARNLCYEVDPDRASGLPG